MLFSFYLLGWTRSPLPLSSLNAPQALPPGLTSHRGKRRAHPWAGKLQRGRLRPLDSACFQSQLGETQPGMDFGSVSSQHPCGLWS